MLSHLSKSIVNFFPFLLLAVIVFPFQALAQLGTSTIKITVGFSTNPVETQINVPALVQASQAIWVKQDSPEIKKALEIPSSPKKTWAPNSFSSNSIPAIPGQPNIPNDAKANQNAFQKPSEPAVSNSAKLPRSQAIDEFLNRRPDITKFMHENTDIRDPEEILKKWVYDVCAPPDRDSSWEEAKEILETYPK